MDIERTIHFILENQAKTEVRITGITKLLQQGMRMLVKTAASPKELVQAQKRTDAKVAEIAGTLRELSQEQRKLAQSQRELAEAQKATEKSLKALMESLRNGRNGH